MEKCLTCDGEYELQEHANECEIFLWDFFSVCQAHISFTQSMRIAKKMIDMLNREQANKWGLVYMCVNMYVHAGTEHINLTSLNSVRYVAVAV